MPVCSCLRCASHWQWRVHPEQRRRSARRWWRRSRRPAPQSWRCSSLAQWRPVRAALPVWRAQHRPDYVRGELHDGGGTLLPYAAHQEAQRQRGNEVVRLLIVVSILDSGGQRSAVTAVLDPRDRALAIWHDAPPLGRGLGERGGVAHRRGVQLQRGPSAPRRCCARASGLCCSLARGAEASPGGSRRLGTGGRAGAGDRDRRLPSVSRR